MEPTQEFTLGIFRGSKGIVNGCSKFAGRYSDHQVRPGRTAHGDDYSSKPAVSLDKLSGVMQREITRNVNLRKKLGLKACTGCISGMDLDIRHNFDHVMQVDLNKVG